MTQVARGARSELHMLMTRPYRSSVFAALVSLTIGGCGGSPAFKSEVNSNTGGSHVAVQLNSEAEFLVIRISNPSEQPMYVDWESAVVRWPNGFDSRLQMEPADPLSRVLPQGSVEYFARPLHYYVPEDAIRLRRSSLVKSLAPPALFRAHESDYRLTVIIPVCFGKDVDCSQGRLLSEGDPRNPRDMPYWSLTQTSVRLVKN